MALQRRTVVTPAPISATPSQAWQGNDGPWSSFVIRVGTPAQVFAVFISTAGQETWVPVPAGCTPEDPSDCGAERGVYPFDGEPSTGFQVNASSTWTAVGLYELGLDSNLNYTGNGSYGFDTVGLDLPNSGGVTLTHQIVAGIADKSFMLGVLGLGPKPTNFTNFNYPQPSFFWSLRNQSLIPSLTWAYTAGALYELTQVPGSLTFGGYDKSRFTPNNVSFSFAADDSKPLTLGLQLIESTNTFQGLMSLLPQGILTFIDSTVPEIWLPVEACTIFETAFGLTYDPNTDRYLVDNTTHANLTAMNPVLTFTLGNTVTGGNTTTISLPYAAFDLKASYPIYETPTNYFPLRRATDPSQYTLGRVFLQEAYLIADFDRGNFSVSQCLFINANPSDIVAILPPSSSSSSSANSGLSHGALIGIIVAAVVLAMLLATGGYIYFQFRKKKNKERSDLEKEAETMVTQPFMGSELDNEVRVNRMSELKGDLPDNRPRELSGTNFHSPELQGGEVVIRNGMPSPVSLLNREPIELDAGGHERRLS